MATRTKQAKTTPQALHAAPAGNPGTGLKQPSPALAELLEWVNLVPPDEKLPFSDLIADDIVETDVLLEALSKLPPPLQAHLLQLMTRPQDPSKVAEMHLAWSGRTDAQARREYEEFGRLVSRNNAVRERYRLIRTARVTFQTIAQGRKGAMTVPVPVEFVLDVDDKRGAFVKYRDPLLGRILGQRLDYIRVCPICKRIFFAGRSNIDACGPPKTCAANLRQSRKRASEKAKLEREQRKAKAKKR